MKFLDTKIKLGYLAPNKSVLYAALIWKVNRLHGHLDPMHTCPSTFLPVLGMIMKLHAQAINADNFLQILPKKVL